MTTFYDRFVECSERWPQNVAVEIQRSDKVESYTYTQLRAMAELFAVWLLSQGMPPGSRVAILAENHPRWVAGYLGIIAAGGVVVPLDTAYHADQVAKILKDSGAELLVCDRKHLPTSQEALAGSGIDLVLTETDVRPNQGPAETPTPHPRSVPGPQTSAQPIADLDTIFAQARPRSEFRPV